MSLLDFYSRYIHLISYLVHVIRYIVIQWTCFGSNILGS